MTDNWPGVRAVDRPHHDGHHSATVYDKNSAVHLPVIDKLLGTFHLPAEAWPDRYGIEGSPVPEGYVGQLVFPFRRRRAQRS